MLFRSTWVQELIKGKIMETTTENYDGIILDIEYDFEDADHSVGLPASVQIQSINHKGVDIYEILDKKIIDSLADTILDRY